MSGMPTVRIAGKRLYYDLQTASDPSPPIVFLHDGLSSSRSWKKVRKKLSQLHPRGSLVYDRWGYGRSQTRTSFDPDYLEAEVPVLLEILDHLSLERVHLVGHSDGGTIALLAAASYPERVLSITAEAAHTFVEEETTEGVAALLEESLDNPPRWLVKHQGKRALLLLRGWAELWMSPEWRQWDIRPMLGKIRCPVMVVQGTEDEFATLAQVDAICQGVSQATSWVAEDCGHVPHADETDEFVRRLAEYLEGEKNRAQTLE